MKTNILLNLFTLLISFSNFATAQSVDLVKDLKPGGWSGLKANHDGIELNEKYFLAAENEDNNLEPYVIADGKINLLKDINPNGNSFPYNFTIYKNKVYFIATDNTHGQVIWETDGTAEGTKIAIDIFHENIYPENFHMFAARNGKMYISAEGNAYISDGTTSGTKQIEGVSKVSFLENNYYKSPGIVNYQGGVAFMHLTDTVATIYYHNGTNLSSLEKIYTNESTSVYGLTEISGDLAYVVRDVNSETKNGIYLIHKNENSTTHSEIVDDTKSRFYIDKILRFTNELAIFKTADQYYVTNGTSAGTLKIFTGKYDLSFGKELPYAIINGKMIIKGSESLTSSKIYLTDGTVAGTSLICTTGPYCSNMIVKDSRVFWFADSIENVNIQLWSADINTHKAEMIYDTKENTIFGSPTIPLAILNNHFYINSFLFGDNGRELYSYSSPILNVHTAVSGGKSYSLVSDNASNTFMVKSETGSEMLELKQYDPTGRIVKSLQVHTNTPFDVEFSNSLTLLEVVGEQGRYCFKIINR